MDGSGLLVRRLGRGAGAPEMTCFYHDWRAWLTETTCGAVSSPARAGSNCTLEAAVGGAELLAFGAMPVGPAFVASLLEFRRTNHGRCANGPGWRADCPPAAIATTRLPSSFDRRLCGRGAGGKSGSVSSAAGSNS